MKAILNTRRNIMGTTSFDGLFPGMRKPQDFIVYPMHAGNAPTHCTVQSDTRIGRVDLATGEVRMSKPRAGGAYAVTPLDAAPFRLSGEDLLTLKAAILSTASGKAGASGIVYTDNSGALEVFGDGPKQP